MFEMAGESGLIDPGLGQLGVAATKPAVESGSFDHVGLELDPGDRLGDSSQIGHENRIGSSVFPDLVDHPVRGVAAAVADEPTGVIKGVALDPLHGADNGIAKFGIEIRLGEFSKIFDAGYHKERGTIDRAVVASLDKRPTPPTEAGAGMMPVLMDDLAGLLFIQVALLTPLELYERPKAGTETVMNQLGKLRVLLPPGRLHEESASEQRVTTKDRAVVTGPIRGQDPPLVV